MKPRSIALFAIALGMSCGIRLACRRAPTTTVGTFNIENFPTKGARQIEGTFALLDTLDLGAIAVQEINDPLRFANEAQARLGDTWRFEACRDCGLQRVGVLYDDAQLELLSTATHRQGRVYPKAKPAFEVRLRRRADDEVMRVVSVHLKAGGGHHETRRKQLHALRPVFARLVASGDRVVIAGDFNATDPRDRVAIEALARDVRLQWATRDLACTSYWNRRDGCLGTPLDHVLTSNPPREVMARGPCEEIGCEPGDTCPTFHAEVSDHCPVTVELAR